MLEVKDATISVSGSILIKNLSLIAPDGEITCIAADDATVLSAFLRVIMGFQSADDGFVSIDGELLTVSSAPAFRRIMCYLPKNINLLRNQLYPPEAIVGEEDGYGVWNQVLPTAAKIDEPAELSAEEVFRLTSETIAKATDKSIIIAEEPTAHLSTELALQLLQKLRDQTTQGKCVLIASSNPQLKSCANNVINLNQINL